jgi:hypothetical protein
MSQSARAGRRRFLASGLAAIGAAPLASAWLAGAARAADLPPLPADNATAVALAYTEDASGAKHPSFKPGSLCSNCQFFSGDAAGARGACSLFPGFSVASRGWCSAWARKA